MRTHRIGTLTFGSGLIIFGLLFMVRTFNNMVTYQFIFNLWPILLIILGCEILWYHFHDKDKTLIYDKGSIFLMIVLSFFAMGMAFCQFVFENGHFYL